MNRLEKVLWEDIVKLLSFKTTNDFIDELALNNVYDENICNISRYIIDPRKLPHYETDTFDIWNTYIEKVLPEKFLDCIEENIDEERACDIEDYFFYMHNRIIYGSIFNFWWTIFDDFVNNKPNDIILNDEMHKIIISYLNYCEKISKNINDYEINDKWDLYINSLYLPENYEEKEEFNYIKDQINKFAFLDISFDFWYKLNEYDDNILNDLKAWAINNYGEETDPLIPKIYDETVNNNE